MSVQEGDVAPDFEMPASGGRTVSNRPLRGKPFVLYFYPKADTPGCTKQACAFRDSIKIIEKENAHVYGISTNTVQELKNFEKKYKLNFTLLSDKKGEISKKFGTKMPILNVSWRYTF